ncbi:MAG: PepSY domain-containing protein [Acidobacteriota bacterium]|nr:PepSY domain-containing protein [Acidobacteriota bacterium]
MSTVRSVLFWLHLAAGVLAGAVVLVMSVTGVALTYEKQMIEWADRRGWSAPAATPSPRLSPEALLAAVHSVRRAAPTTLTLRANPLAPATVVLDGDGAILVDPYTGVIIGPPPAGLRSFFRTMTNWHRWLAMSGDGRATGRAITGASNLVFLCIIISGIYLWIPRIRTWLQFRQVLWFRRGLASKARDFNWHNVIGIWSAMPLALVVAGAVPISYPWASHLVYRTVGEEPPPRPAPRSERPERPAAAAVDLAGIDAGYRQAVARVPSWFAISIRVPRGPQSALTYTVDEGYGGQPQKRGTLTVDRATGLIDKWEAFGDQSAGRRLRSWFRFVHTGEYYGLTGQTIAGLVSAGGTVLVYTGLALAWRRFVAWRGARRPAASARESRAA